MATKKGAFVQQMESVANSLADDMVGGVQHLRDQNGPVPFGAVEHTPDEIAQRELPLWYARGNATGQVAQQFWDAKVDAPNPSNPDFAGPVAAAAYHAQMQRLWANPAHRAAAFAAMAPDLKQELAQLIATGQHPGRAVTLKDGVVTPLDEPGDMQAHLPGPGGG